MTPQTDMLWKLRPVAAAVAACGLAAMLLAAGCGDGRETSEGGATGGEGNTGRTASTAGFALNSPAFEPGQPIPQRYCYRGVGDNVSPKMTWTVPPAGTVEFALIADDPDAPSGTWVHWVAYKIPAKVRSLPENLPASPALAVRGGTVVQGTNSFNEIGWGGPAPPPGPRHRYFFRLYALDQKITLPVGATKAQLLEAMQGHILATAELMGTYQTQ